jgi:hypothetical protein
LCTFSARSSGIFSADGLYGCSISGRNGEFLNIHNIQQCNEKAHPLPQCETNGTKKILESAFLFVSVIKKLVFQHKLTATVDKFQNKNQYILSSNPQH